MSLWEIYKAKRLGYADDLWTSLIGHRLGGYSWLSDYETTPYLYRAMPNLSHYYNREIMEEVVGASVAWNQLFNHSDIPTTIVADVTWTNNGDGSVTLNGTSTGRGWFGSFQGASVENHVYYIQGAEGLTIHTGSWSLTSGGGKQCIAKCGAGLQSGYNAEVMVSGKSFNNVKFYPQLTDLTLALGSTIADYVYSLEQATAGSGVAWLKEHFPKMCQYNPYDAGSIQSVSGLVSHTTKDANDNVIGSYPLDSTLTLRGIPKLDASNNLYYDGDIYESDGTVTRKYGVVDLGTLTWVKGVVTWYTNDLKTIIKPPASNSVNPTLLLSSKQYIPKSSDADSGVAGTYEMVVSQLGQLSWRYPMDAYSTATEFATAMSGVYLVYELATPTTETAQPFAKTQLCDSGGTEEFVTSGIVSVGHKSKYAEK